MDAVKCRAERCKRPAGKDGLCATHREVLALKRSGKSFKLIAEPIGKLEAAPVGKLGG